MSQPSERAAARLYRARVGALLISGLLSALPVAGEEGGAAGTLIKRVQLTSASHRPSAIAFAPGGDLKIVTAPFGALGTRDGRTLMPIRGVMHRPGSPPISPVSLVVAPNGTVYAAGYMQQIARSRLDFEGHSGPMEPWLGRTELGNVAPIALAVDSKGGLFAADLGGGTAGSQGVVRIDRETGAVEVRVPPGGSGLQSARALAFDSLDKLYVADMRTGAVLRFRRGSGELDRVIVQPSGDGESRFIGLSVGANGKLYVLDSGRAQVLGFTIDVPGPPEVLIDLSADSSHEAMSMAVSPTGDIAVLTEGTELLLYAGDGPGAAPGSWPVTARAEPAAAPSATADRPAAPRRRRLHLGVDRSAARGYRQADRGVLLREIYRQGLALAAIDEVGALLRDQGLGESAPADALELVASVLVLPGQTVRLGLADPASPTVPLWSRDLPVGDGQRVDYLEAIAEVERLARERWPAALRELGLEAAADQPPAAGARDPGEPPPAAELDVLSQLLRVRSAHRRLGAAEERSLEELALGYANLAFATSFHWSEANESLRARSLLYAERLAVAHPSPRALRVRAYARALAGFHAAALDDLGSAGDAPGALSWQEAVAAFCRTDYARLARLAAAGGDGADLAGRLAFRVIAASGSNVLLRRTSQVVLEKNPRAWEVYAGLGLSDDFGLEGWGASALERNLAQLGARLAATPGLPTSIAPEEEPSAIAEMLESLKQWWSEMVSGAPDAMPSVAVEVARQLDTLSEAAADDDGQPSWQALDYLLGETLFAQIERKIGFEALSRAVEVDWLLELIRPLWRDHPLAGLIEIYTLEPQLERERLRDLVSDLELAQPRPELAYLRRQLEVGGERAATATIWSELGIERSALDETADDLTRLLVHSRDASVARRLRKVSPESPAALAELITWDRAAIADRLEGWRAKPVHPQIARELAARYRRGQEPEQALEVLERYVEEIPDTWAYDELASIHLELDDVDAWVRTLEDYLAATDQDGLEEDRFRERLAWHYNQRGEFSKARPYADRAAQSWAHWGLKVAAWTHEGLGDWERAEQLRRNVSERYDTARTHWYLWCRRTGRGDLDAARRLAESVLADRRERDGTAPMEVAVFLLLEGDLEAAERELRSVFEETGNPLAGLHLAFVLFDLERPEAMEVLAQVSERGRAFVEKEYVLGELLEVTAASRGLLAGELTPESHREIVERILATVNEGYRVNAEYFLARFLERAGREAEARERLERCAEAWYLGMWNSTLAAVRLRELY